jgi:hypothetical protein
MDSSVKIKKISGVIYLLKRFLAFTFVTEPFSLIVSERHKGCPNGLVPTAEPGERPEIIRNQSNCTTTLYVLIINLKYQKRLLLSLLLAEKTGLFKEGWHII